MDIIPVGAIAALIGLATGIVLGLAARLGNFCTLGAIESAIYGDDQRRLRMWGIVLGTAIFTTHLLAADGKADLGATVYHSVAWNPLASILGGALFGYGMALAGNCGFGALARFGGGDGRFEVSTARCADRDDVDLGVVEHRFERIVRLTAMLGRESLRLRHRAVEAANQLRAANVADRFRMKVGNHPRADDSESCRHVRNSFVVSFRDSGRSWIGLLAVLCSGRHRSGRLSRRSAPDRIASCRPTAAGLR